MSSLCKVCGRDIFSHTVRDYNSKGRCKRGKPKLSKKDYFDPGPKKIQLPSKKKSPGLMFSITLDYEKVLAFAKQVHRNKKRLKKDDLDWCQPVLVVYNDGSALIEIFDRYEGVGVFAEPEYARIPVR